MTIKIPIKGRYDFASDYARGLVGLIDTSYRKQPSGRPTSERIGEVVYFQAFSRIDGMRNIDYNLRYLVDSKGEDLPQEDPRRVRGVVEIFSPLILNGFRNGNGDLGKILRGENGGKTSSLKEGIKHFLREYGCFLEGLPLIVDLNHLETAAADISRYDLMKREVNALLRAAEKEVEEALRQYEEFSAQTDFGRILYARFRNPSNPDDPNTVVGMLTTGERGLAEFREDFGKILTYRRATKHGQRKAREELCGGQHGLRRQRGLSDPSTRVFETFYSLMEALNFVESFVEDRKRAISRDKRILDLEEELSKLREEMDAVSASIETSREYTDEILKALGPDDSSL